MIKVGTVCLLVGTMRESMDGMCCTTTSGLHLHECILGNRCYSVELARPVEGGTDWTIAEFCLRPLNDPDSIVDERHREGITA